MTPQGGYSTLGPALAPPGSLQGIYGEETRARTWDFSASLEASHSMRGERTRKELVSGRIREWARWNRGGKQAESSRNSWPWGARMLQGVQLQVGRGLIWG